MFSVKVQTGLSVYIFLTNCKIFNKFHWDLIDISFTVYLVFTDIHARYVTYFLFGIQWIIPLLSNVTYFFIWYPIDYSPIKQTFELGKFIGSL